MEDLLEFVEQISEWHSAKVANLNVVIALVKEGVTLQSPAGEDLTKLTKDQAMYFKAGLQLALGEFEKLPFSVTRTAEPDIHDEED